MMEDSLTKRSIEIVKNFSEQPLVKMEQTKLIQIVINLIKNAYEAMDHLEKEQRKLIITSFFEKGPPDYVVLSIKDFGIGLTPEEKEKIFQFGYTTKTRGSGFGLHTCANYLIANNGSITAISEGRGKGAEFLIRLPVSNSSSTIKNN